MGAKPQLPAMFFTNQLLFRKNGRSRPHQSEPAGHQLELVAP
jgi:hypothetical protein